MRHRYKTISIDPQKVQQLKIYAARNGRNIKDIIEEYIDGLTRGEYVNTGTRRN